MLWAKRKIHYGKTRCFFMTYRLFNAFFPLVTSAYIARVLLPEGVGKIAVAQNIVTYFTYIAALGMPTYGMRVIEIEIVIEET